MSNQGQSEILVPTIEQQSSFIDQSASFGTAVITGALTGSNGAGVYSYNSVTGVYTVLKKAKFVLEISASAAGATAVIPAIYVNGVLRGLAHSPAAINQWATAAWTEVLESGSFFSFNNAQATTNNQRLSVSAEAVTTTSVAVNDLVPAKAVLGNTSLDIPNLTAWQGYTPTFTGFGTATNIEFEWRQVGENAEIRGKFTSGTPTGVEARIGLPAGLTSAGTGVIPSLQVIGTSYIDASATVFFGESVLIEPSVSYLTFGRVSSTTNGLTKANANSIVSASDLLSFFASVPCAGLSATEQVVVSGTQSALVQEADTSIRLDTYNGYGSTYNKIPRFSAIRDSLGGDIAYSDSATLGASFTVVTSGIYSITYSMRSPANGRSTVGITKNVTAAEAILSPDGITDRSKVLAQAFSPVPGDVATSSCAWTGYLISGDIIRPHSNGIAPDAAGNTHFTISRQGSLKQINVSSDQKITIPTSELRFEGASARGSTDTAIVKFDTQAKIRGDAFSVVNTAANGTVITMLKAGKLGISTSLVFAAAAGIYITKNQAVLTGSSTTASELLSVSTTTTGGAGTVAWGGTVEIGDIIRISAVVNPASNSLNSFNLSFQEQDIQVSVSNTLPQFSESDTSLRLFGTNGYGSINTTTRRFASTIQNIGTDIEYIDSATLGGQFIAKAAGIYSVSFSEQSNANLTVMFVAIRINGSDVAVDNQVYTTAAALNKTASTSWQGYLNVGDIVTAAVNAAAENNGLYSSFTMSKVGKPNVTGVDVTPFVNVEIPSQLNTQGDYIPTATAPGSSDLAASIDSTQAYGSGIYLLQTGQVTVLKDCIIDITYRGPLNQTQYSIDIRVNGTVRAINFGRSGSAGVWSMTANLSSRLKSGDVVTFGQTSAALASSLTIAATDLQITTSDTILTAPETFSTDTAALTYAGSGAYTLATLNTAPVGTFITFTQAASFNTAVQTTTAPTQTVSSMNTNGIILTARAYSAASTAALPSIFCIQIGKGLKGITSSLYTSAGKTASTPMDFSIISTAIERGTLVHYNESTGVITLDSGTASLATNTTRNLDLIQAATSGYLVINASKNPALTGLVIDVPIAAKMYCTSGQSIANSANAKIVFNVLSFSKGNINADIVTGRFNIQKEGQYRISSFIMFNSAAFSAPAPYGMSLYKNGVFFAYLFYKTLENNTTGFLSLLGTTTLYMNVGDYVEIYVNNSTGAAKSIYTNGETSDFCIEYVGK